MIDFLMLEAMDECDIYKIICYNFATAGNLENLFGVILGNMCLS